MIDRGTLLLVVIGLACAVSAAAGAIVCNATVRARRRRRLDPELTAGRWRLARMLAEGSLSGDGAEALLALPPRRLHVLLGQFLGPLATADAAVLRGLAEQAGLIDRGLRLTRSRFWWRRLAGARVLTSLGVEGGWLEALARDRSPLVRAQVSAFAADRPTDALIEHLVGQLTDGDGLCRFRAKNSLVKLGERAAPALARCLAESGGTQRANVLAVAVHIDSPALAAASVRLLADGSALIRAGAATVIGRAGAADLAERVEPLLDDPDACVRAAAAGALGRLGAWGAAGSIERLLGDPSWDVRRAAAFALKSLGPPGLLLLRAATCDSDPFAADMARQVLDLTELEQAA